MFEDDAFINDDNNDNDDDDGGGGVIMVVMVTKNLLPFIAIIFVTSVTVKSMGGTSYIYIHIHFKLYCINVSIRTV